MPNFDKDSCYTASGKYCACIEFHLDEEHRHGFHTSQLIEYTLEANPDAADDKDIPPQRLALVFSTADVVVLGWRLGLLADKLQENDLAAVRALPKRYADVDRHTPFVASIAVTSIEAGKDRNSPK
jgi:phage tail protein X